VRLEGEAVSVSLFSILGVRPVLGRTFNSDDTYGGLHVVVIAHGLWVSHFGADPQILEKSILLDGVRYRVIGVSDRSFRFPDSANFHGAAQADQLWVPIALNPADLSDHRNHSLQGAVARLKPHITLAEAQAQMDVIAWRLTDEHPEANRGVGIKVVPMREELVGNVEFELWVLLGSVGLVFMGTYWPFSSSSIDQSS